jgi:hypothetical protein
MSDPVCLWCDEPVTDLDLRAPNYGPPMHWECGLRSVVGGLNHQLGRCMCCGGTEDPDPPHLSRRDAARAAAEHYIAMNPV